MKNKISVFLANRQIKYVFIDFLVAALSVFISLFVCNYQNFLQNTTAVFTLFLVYPVACICASHIFSSYQIIWKYANPLTYMRLVFVYLISDGVLFVSNAVVSEATKNLDVSHYNFYVLLFLLNLVFAIIIRVVLSYLTNTKKDTADSLRGNIMIIGGGSAGNLIINDIRRNSKKSQCKIKCIVDDDVRKLGQNVNGVTIEGQTSDIVALAEKHQINLIVFAIPTCSSDKKASILEICQKTNCKIRILPSYYQLVDGSFNNNVNVATLREVQIEDLLGREPISISNDKVLNYINDKTVIVTGGGGSIGSELCRQIAKQNPKKLIIFDIYENNAYDIQNELKREYSDLDLVVLIGSVRDKERLNAVFEKYKPEIVFHAAAHKHVPLMEDSPNEAIKNNVFGTFNVAKTADEYGVKRFILISTDKAVNPTNIMGASKRICEMIIQYFSNNSKTEFVAVRFGNVLGSNGSVIPLFKKQISEGGPVTVTDPNIIRYFMTIPEAVSLVLQAGASAKGGEIFVLDMGKPVKIIDLAENLIRLSGYKPYTEIKIEFTGLRPGEKMYEEKLLSEEGLKRTENSLIHIGRPISFDQDEFVSALDSLRKNMGNDDFDVKAVVKSIVHTYNYQ